jgi:sugar O-acyltransferase (sialic acid O-acetyltransferase NeuD family)
MKRNIILIGAGGHAKSCIDLIQSSTDFNIKYIIGLKKELGRNIFGIKVMDNQKNLNELKKIAKYAIIGLGQIKSYKKRKDYFLKLKRYGFKIPKIISKNAILSKYSFIDEGTVVMNGSIINANVNIGKNCIINTKSLIEHDCDIGDNVHISTGAIINGGVKIGSGSFIGSGAVIIQDIKIGKNCIIGAGKLVKKNLKDNQKSK